MSQTALKLARYLRDGTLLAAVGRRAGRRLADLDVDTPREVNRGLKTLLSDPQVSPPPRQELKLAKEYSRQVLGSRRYYPWFRLYTVYRSSFREGWIPDNFFRDILPVCNGPYHHITGARSLS